MHYCVFNVVLKLNLKNPDGSTNTVNVVSIEIIEDDGTPVFCYGQAPKLSIDERVLAFVNNESSTTLEILDKDVELDARAARNIIADRPFLSIEDLDSTPYVGPSALKKLREFV